MISDTRIECQHAVRADWLEPATELVDTGRWSDLTDRAFRTFAQKHSPVSRYEELPLRQQFRELHWRFREHMISEATS